MLFHEDFIVIIILFNIAESFRFIEKYGYVNIIRYKIAPARDLNLLDMYLLDTLIDFSKNSFENKKIISEFVLHLMDRDIVKTLNKSEDNKKLFISILKRIFSSQYIFEKDKKRIKNYFIKFNFLNRTRFNKFEEDWIKLWIYKNQEGSSLQNL